MLAYVDRNVNWSEEKPLCSYGDAVTHAGVRELCGGPHSSKYPFTPALGKPDKFPGLPSWPLVELSSVCWWCPLRRELAFVYISPGREGVPATVVKPEREQEREERC